MAYPIELTIGTGNKVTVKYQSQEVSVSLTYRLERDDTDVLAVAREKAPEVVAVHGAAWESVRGLKPAAKAEVTETRPKPIQSVSAPIEEADAGPDSAVEPGIEIRVVSNTAKESNPNVGTGDYEHSTPGQSTALKALLTQSGAGEEDIQESLITRYGCEGLDELSYSQACEWLLELQRAERERVRLSRNKLTQTAVHLNGKGNN